MTPETPTVGTFKYSGQLVSRGIIDAKSGASALTGIDAAMRHFIAQELPLSIDDPIPIPVKIAEGSWEARIPDIAEMIKLGLLGAGAVYTTNAIKKVAENDFKEKGFKDVAKDAMNCIQWFIRIGKHVGHTSIKTLENLQWDKAEQRFVDIINTENKALRVPVSIFKRLISCPKDIIQDLARVIEIERTLEVSIHEADGVVTVDITKKDRAIFFSDSEEDNILFPELLHGMQVELIGVITRGNEMSNTIGFHYNGHILTCAPNSGSIVRFKRNLFLSCRISGTISRMDKKGSPVEKRPKILFDTVESISEDMNMTLNLPLGEALEDA